MTKGGNNERVFNYMRENSLNNVFSGSYGRIAKALKIKNTATVSYAIKQLVKQGKIEVLVEPQRGLNTAKYKVVNTDVERSVDAPLGEIIIEFGGVKLKLVYTDLGYCISKSDLSKVFVNNSMITIEEYSRLIDLKIERNKEQFIPNMTVVNGEQYFNRVAVMLYFNKLDLVQANQEKRNMLNDLQTTLANSMCDVILRGHVTLSSNDKVRLQTNIASLCELDKDQVKDFLDNIENEMQYLMNNKTREVESISKKLREAEYVIKQKNDLIDVQKSQITELRLNN